MENVWHSNIDGTDTIYIIISHLVNPQLFLLPWLKVQVSHHTPHPPSLRKKLWTVLSKRNGNHILPWSSKSPRITTNTENQKIDTYNIFHLSTHEHKILPLEKFWFVDLRVWGYWKTSGHLGFYFNIEKREIWISENNWIIRFRIWFSENSDPITPEKPFNTADFRVPI